MEGGQPERAKGSLPRSAQISINITLKGDFE